MILLGRASLAERLMADGYEALAGSYDDEDRAVARASTRRAARLAD